MKLVKDLRACHTNQLGFQNCKSVRGNLDNALEKDNSRARQHTGGGIRQTEIDRRGHGEGSLQETGGKGADVPVMASGTVPSGPGAE